jgi:hypothetical protein
VEVRDRPARGGVHQERVTAPKITAADDGQVIFTDDAKLTALVPTMAPLLLVRRIEEHR